MDVAGQRALHALPVPRPVAGDPPRRRRARANWPSPATLSEEKVFGAKPLKDVAIKVDISGPYEMSAEQGVNARSLASYYAAAVGKTGVRFTRQDEPDFSTRT